MDLIEMEVKSVGKKIEYIKPDGTTTSRLCAVKAKDKSGNEHKAYAWGNLCDDLKVGTKVLATQRVPPKNERDGGRFVIYKCLK
ncbi:MAG: hypothetical protein OIN66_12150 [Candidatus Methanoperedens sp.]|nr:hypothetical protein [Candidatus Methanoperedens sp.]